MFCVIYRSSKQDQTYLFIEKKDDFSRVPVDLIAYFGKPVFSMILLLDGNKKLVLADVKKIKKILKDQGFYLQISSLAKNLLR